MGQRRPSLSRTPGCLPTFVPLTDKMAVNPKPKSHFKFPPTFSWTLQSKQVKKWVMSDPQSLSPSVISYLWTSQSINFNKCIYVAGSVSWTHKRLPRQFSQIWVSSSRKQHWGHCIYSNHILTHRLHEVWLKEQKAVAHYTVHKHQRGQTITESCIYLRNKTTVTLNHCLLKG